MGAPSLDPLGGPPTPSAFPRGPCLDEQGLEVRAAATAVGLGLYLKILHATIAGQEQGGPLTLALCTVANPPPPRGGPTDTADEGSTGTLSLICLRWRLLCGIRGSLWSVQDHKYLKTDNKNVRVCLSLNPKPSRSPSVTEGMSPPLTRPLLNKTASCCIPSSRKKCANVIHDHLWQSEARKYGWGAPQGPPPPDTKVPRLLLPRRTPSHKGVSSAARFS